MRVEFCTGCHARGNEEGFERLMEALERRLGIGYFGGFSRDHRLEVDFVPCLDHCNQGYSVSLDGEVLVLPDEASLLALVDRLAEAPR